MPSAFSRRPMPCRRTGRAFFRQRSLSFRSVVMVYCYPGKSNYLGGDIISGMVATELYKKEGISVFLT
ncbi:MAG: hypothetical protein ACLR2E_22875 [Lachnospiraceae bacterium]